ncbi:MAG: GntR family transcriptional regulator, partial [Chitinivibrionales bacterium]|nr:GntR family transcriptional regulator [Chitinivibrionales bacterium]
MLGKLGNEVERWVAALLERCGPGDRLPSDREIAHQLRVSERTVRSVMTVLAARDVVVRVRGKGTFAPGAAPELSPPAQPQASPRSSAANVAEHLAAAIRDGSIRSGDQLPQVKALCMSYRVNATTVSAALRDLMARGLVCRVGRRFFVGRFATAVGPTRPGRVDFFSPGPDDIDRSLSRFGMRPAYAKMER